MKHKVDSIAHPNDGERLFRLRTSMKLTQKEMGDLLECSEKSIHNYENAITQTPLNRRRTLCELTGIDVNPFDPEQDPYLITVQYRDRHNTEKLTETPDQTTEPKNLFARIRHFRASSRARLQDELTPARRAVENTIFTAYMTATAVTALELFQRSIGGWQTHQMYHDVLLAGSVVAAFFLLLPAWLTTSWGTTVETPRGI